MTVTHLSFDCARYDSDSPQSWRRSQWLTHLSSDAASNDSDSPQFWLRSQWQWLTSVLTPLVMTVTHLSSDCARNDSDSPQSWRRSQWQWLTSILTALAMTVTHLSSDAASNDSDSPQFWLRSQWRWLTSVLTALAMTVTHLSPDGASNDSDSPQFWLRSQWQWLTSVLTALAMRVTHLSSDCARNDSDSPQFWRRSVSGARNVDFRALCIIIAWSTGSSLVSVFVAVLRPHDSGCSTFIGYHIFGHGPVWRRPLAFLPVRRVRPFKNERDINSLPTGDTYCSHGCFVPYWASASYRVLERGSFAVKTTGTRRDIPR